jgi:predicted alpha/beta superfamily hydrolase
MKMKTRLLILGLLIVLGYAGNIATAQSSGVRDSLYSDILQEQRYIQIRIPDNYDPESYEKYTTIYLLDGEWNIELFPFIHIFTRQEGYLPEAIFIGLPNTYINNRNQRDRDFLPSNNADGFLDFLEQELIPYIDKNYPSSGENILFGHSYGGLFTMYTYLSRPHLFESYIATDPPFSWNNGYVLHLAADTFKVRTDLYRALWIAGIESTYRDMGIASMDSLFRIAAPENLHWKVTAYPNETHNSVRLKGVYDGLKFIYDGYNANLQFHPRGGIILEEKPVTVWIFSDNPEAVRYTLDGTEPDATSKPMEREIYIAEPSTMIVRYMSGGSKYGKRLQGSFKSGDVLPAIAKPENAIQGEWAYSYYEGEWDRLPDFNMLEPVSTGRVDNDFDIRSLPRSTDFACLIEGYIEIPEEGYYLFGMDSDDGSKLYIGDHLIIDLDGLHGRGNPQSYVVPLEKGFYPIRLEYFQRGQDYGLDFIYLPPGRTEIMPVPTELRYSVE